MTVSRRKTLALIGGGAILAASGATGVVAMRKPQSALRPWLEAGGYEDPRMRALSYAILAPNPHNRQPWKVDLSKPDHATLFVDTERLLPHTDPFSRQIVIGLGCFLEQLRLAAAQDGWDVSFDVFPDGEDPKRLDARPVAEIQFIKRQAHAEPALFNQVMQRRSLKEPFDTNRPVTASSLSEILAAVQHTTGAGTIDADEIGFWRDLTHEALRIEIETPHTYKESVDLFRIGAREVDANPDGIDFSGAMFEVMRATGLFTRDTVLDTTSTAYAEGLKSVFANTDTAMGYVWLTTSSNSRADQIAAGRDWLRVNLAATGLGIGLQPLSQALQEYPEMDALYTKVHETLAPGGETVQMFARIGYGPTVPQSPRWPVEAKIL